MEKWRYRIKFAKTEPMRYTGNLDVQSALERTIRRAHLPLLYSQGFNPRPRINLASALPLGVTSQEEIADIWFEKKITAVNVKEKLIEASPPGLTFLNVEIIDLQAPTLQTQLQYAEYSITFLEPFNRLPDSIENLFAQEEIIRVRRGTQYDLRPLLVEWKELPVDQSNHQRILVRLSASQDSIGRPDEVVDALGYPHEATRIHRVRLFFRY
jgi:radical SAM-linked protein